MFGKHACCYLFYTKIEKKEKYKYIQGNTHEASLKWTPNVC